jgi:hypothetical protein
MARCHVSSRSRSLLADPRHFDQCCRRDPGEIFALDQHQPVTSQSHQSDLSSRTGGLCTRYPTARECTQTFTLMTDMRQHEFIQRFQLPGIDIYDADLQQRSRSFVELIAEACVRFDGRKFDQNRAFLARGYSRAFRRAGLPLNSGIEQLALS